MPRLLALEWDTREARVVVGRSSGHDLTVEAVLSCDLQSESDVSLPQVLNDRLSGLLETHGGGRGDWIIGLSRGLVELRLLQTPQVPPDELPDLVRFQALRQFSSVADDWPLDYVPLHGSGKSQQRVLAAAVSPSVMHQVEEVCAANGGSPQRIVLRPFAAASLYRRHQRDSVCRVLIEPFAEEADLTVLVDGQVVLVRSVRLPEADRAAALVAEIRRTIAAAQNMTGEQPVEAATLLGDAGRLSEMRTSLTEQLELNVDIFDPFEAVKLGSQARTQIPEDRGRYAALLGMLQDEAEGISPTIDFLHPRRRPKARNRRMRLAALGAISALCVIVFITMIYTHLSRYDTNLAMLKQESEELNAQVKIANDLKAEVAEIDKFILGEVNWLNEVYKISRDFPGPQDAIVDMATFNSIPNGGGQILLEGYVRDPSVITEMEERLRDKYHQVSGTGSQLDSRRDELPWDFKETILVLPQDLEAFATEAASPKLKTLPEEMGVEESVAEEVTPDTSESAEPVEAEPPQDAQPPDDTENEGEDSNENGDEIIETSDDVVEATIEEGTSNDEA